MINLIQVIKGTGHQQLFSPLLKEVKVRIDEKEETIYISKDNIEYKLNKFGQFNGLGDCMLFVDGTYNYSDWLRFMPIRSLLVCWNNPYDEECINEVLVVVVNENFDISDYNDYDHIIPFEDFNFNILRNDN